jgi:protein-disulfide isomerase
MLKKISSRFVIILLILVWNNSCYLQRPQVSEDELKSLRKDVDALKERQAATQKEIQEIKNTLQVKQPPPPPPFKETTLSIKGDQSQGNKDAKLVLIEFFDYQ